MVTAFRIEFDGRARREGLCFARGTGDRESAHVDVEVLLGEERCAVACDPRLAQRLAAAVEDVGDGARAEVATVDV